MHFVTVAALIISIRYYSRHKNLQILTWYIAFCLLQDIASVYAFPFLPRGASGVILWHTVTIAFMFFEFTVCSLFILHHISAPKRRRIIRINSLLFFVF